MINQLALLFGLGALTGIVMIDAIFCHGHLFLGRIARWLF